MIITSHNFAAHSHPTLNTSTNNVVHSEQQTESAVNEADKSQQANDDKRSRTERESTPFKGLANKTKVEGELNEQELKQLRELRQRDREVRAHEQAHAAAAGSLAKGGPSYSYQRGPDGKSYAVGGEVQIDTSAVSGDAEATAAKAQQIRRAALAPAQPSQQDRAVAAAASAMESRARIEIAREKQEDAVEKLNARFSDGQNDVKDEGVDKLGETKDMDVHSKCAQCGGQHSAESHNVSINLDKTFSVVKPEEQTLFNVAV